MSELPHQGLDVEQDEHALRRLAMPVMKWVSTLASMSGVGRTASPGSLQHPTPNPPPRRRHDR